MLVNTGIDVSTAKFESEPIPIINRKRNMDKLRALVFWTAVGSTGAIVLAACSDSSSATPDQQPILPAAVQEGIANDEAVPVMGGSCVDGGNKVGENIRVFVDVDGVTSHLTPTKLYREIAVGNTTVSAYCVDNVQLNSGVAAVYIPA